MEPRLRATPEQFSVLLDFMERNGDLSKPQPGPQGRIKSDRLWKKLTNMLNSLGGGIQKSTDKWKKVWADWKTKTKKKYLCLRQQARGTGGGPSRRRVLTALEERVVAIIGGSAVVRQASIREQGFIRVSSEPMNNAGSTIEVVLDQQNNSTGIEPEHHIENIISTPVISHLPELQFQTQQRTPRVIIARAASGTEASSPPSPSSERPSREPPSRTVDSFTSVESPTRNNRRQSSASPPRRVFVKARRNRGLTPFERAADQFAAIEQRRIQHEIASDKRLHEREMQRLELDAERLEVARAHNTLLHQLIHLCQRAIDVIQRPGDRSPPTDPLD